MNRLELAHLLRAACTITGDRDVLVLGSQSILGSFDEDELPAVATVSMEADIAFLEDADRAKADRVEAVAGELSTFHSEFGVYAEGIHIDTAVLPDGWRERLRTWTLRSSEPATPRFLDPYDLAVSKLAAGRPKDTEFVTALVDAGLLDVDQLRARAAILSSAVDERVHQRVSQQLDGLTRAATAPGAQPPASTPQLDNAPQWPSRPFGEASDNGLSL